MNKKIRKFSLSAALLSTVILLGTTTTITTRASQTDTYALSQSQFLISSVSVTNWEEFKAAIEDQSVTDITLTNNLTLEETLLAQGSIKNIHGNGYTIDADLKQIKVVTSNSTALMEDVKINNTDIYGLLWSDFSGVEVTYRDVEHNGEQLIYLPLGKLILDGNVTSLSTLEEVYQGKEMEVYPNANVTFETTSSSLPALSLLYTDATLKVDSKAKLKATANGVTINGGNHFILESEGELEITSNEQTAIRGLSNSSYDFRDGSVLKAIANDPIEEGIEAVDGSIIIRSGSIFELESYGTQGTVITGESLIFEDGSNFSIINHNTEGRVFGAYGLSTNVELTASNGVDVWENGNFSGEPTLIYGDPVEATFTLSGYLNTVSQTNLNSDNYEFENNFDAGKTRKITGGSYTSTKIGDLNKDGKVTQTDIDLLEDYLESPNNFVYPEGVTPEQFLTAADLDSDMVLTLNDLTLLQEQVSEIV